MFLFQIITKMSAAASSGLSSTKQDQQQLDQILLQQFVQKALEKSKSANALDIVNKLHSLILSLKNLRPPFISFLMTVLAWAMEIDSTSSLQSKPNFKNTIASC